MNKLYIKSLEAASIDNVEKLHAMTMNDLGKINGIGVTGQVEMIRVLNELGLKLRVEYGR